ncbi:hypothetical protein GJ744_008429 [Endocarpon pusillum]|uniref:Manganese/iron superoxide dismutase C-terminal domain-containing protein n=1 Tax=Endocarpon pusillum TaxID=364733 RepID=A0A8H7E3C6_9EURO|nr:hypothetical protein GJ744_008429 [Endocarpon pusillum]
MGTADATTKPQRLVEKYGRSSEQASLFNHASMACNNHTFFSCLSPRKTEPSPTFVSEIKDSFSSYETLRIEMIETADAMFGPGFVWIVKDEKLGDMKLLCTYLAGSPHKLAHFRSQQNDMATYNTNALSASRMMSGREPRNSAGSFGSYSRNAAGSDHALGGYNSFPILCVNTWEHAYLRDYGIGGKRTYLERWWDRVDWAVVEGNARLYGPEMKKYPANAKLDARLGNSFRKHQSLTT